MIRRSDLGRPPRRFTALWPRAGGVALFAEHAHFLIDLPDARVLDPSAEVDLGTLDPERLARLRADLADLAARGFWLPSGAEDDPTAYLTPDFTAPPRAIDATGRWVSLADPNEDPLIEALAAALDLPSDLAAVVVDDPLDPRLSALSQELRADRRPWLLLRLAGDHPTAGPLFGASDHDACHGCLAFRVLWNQPVRRWYHQAHAGGLAPVPVAFRPRVVERGLPRFAEAARRIVEARTGGAMTEIDWSGPRSIAHPVLRRPQCPACGDPTLFATRAETPVALHPAPRAFDEDGGFRTRLPEETAIALDRIVSPLGGLVAGVACHSEPGPDRSRIFRAWFGKTTFGEGLPRTEQLFQTTLGKGMSEAQSRVSAISEALERLAGNHHGDEPVITARAADLPGRSFPPRALAPYSEAQYRAFQAAFDAGAAPLHAMLSAGPDEVLPWTPVWSLTRGERCFVPFTWCYASTPYDGDRRCRFFHNGGAAGNCLEEAILQGWLELVERDAVAVWWYNRLRRPAVRFTVPDALARQLAATVGAHSDHWVLDVTHDLRVPVFVAVSRRRDTGKLCLGFGSHLDARLAVRRALTELCQILEIRDRHSAPFDFDAIAPEDHLFPDEGQTPVPLDAYAPPSSSDIAEDVRGCVSRAAELGLEVLVLDYSRPDFPLRTAKVIMPGTCHIFPYRGAARLYEVPVRMGWRGTPLDEAHLNPLDLLI